MNILDIIGLYMMITMLGALAFSFVFWMWMLVDCVKRKKFKDKPFWIIVILLLNIIGSVAYFLAAKNTR